MDSLGDFVRSAPTVLFILMMAFPVALAGIFFVVALWALRNARTLAAQKPVPVSALSGGYQLAEGIVSGEHVVRAPLTGRECAWYDLKVEEDVETRYQNTRDTTRSWKTVREEMSGKPIRIVEGGATCLVDPRGAMVNVTEWSEWYGPAETPSERNPDRHPGDTTPGGSGRIELHTAAQKFRYLERYIHAGDPIFALGLATPTRGKKGAPPAFAMKRPNDRSPFIVSTRSPETVGGESDLAMQGGFIMAAICAGVAAALWLLRFG